ncbi:MAG: transposase [Candidatus Parcubacteria bacterium]|nr:transposase [Candidatus Parcubacteria bacterium]
MPRTDRVDVCDVIYHVINRANARAQIFYDDADYFLFEELLRTAKEEVVDMRILSYCIMPNHWHLVLQPKKDGDMSQFMRWLQVTHTRRWHIERESVGSGHLYQGRYKSFPVEADSYLLSLLRYVERNPLRAKMVEHAEDWRWSSLWIKENGTPKQKKMLEEWPIDVPDNYSQWVNESQTVKELDDIHSCIKKNRPFGTDEWVDKICKKFDLGSTLREAGRPKTI